MRAALSALRRDRAGLLLLALLLLGLPLVTTRIYASDEVKYFAYLHSLSFDHDLDFTNDYQHWVERGYADIATLLKRNPATGLPINEAPIGTAILWAPAFSLAHLGVLAARALGAHVAADGYSPPYIAAICYASYLYGWAGLLLVFRLLRRRFGDGPALIATLATWLGTAAFFYMVIAPPWSHAASLFAVSLFVTVLLGTGPLPRRSPRAWAGLGLCAGLMMLIREQDALFLLLPAVETLAWLMATYGAPRAPARAPAVLSFAAGPLAPSQPALARPSPTTDPQCKMQNAKFKIAAGWALCLAVAAVTFTPQLIVYKVLGGRFAPSSTVSEKLDWLAPHALDVLGSPRYGLLPWAPLVALALAGLLVLARGERLLAAGLGLAFLAQVYVAGSYATWMGASSFGQRRFVNCTVIFAFGLAALLAWAWERGALRWLVLGLTALCVAWELGLVMQYAAVWSTAQRQVGLRWPAVLGDQVRLVTRVPTLAWNYLFHRSSFTKRGLAP